jgi:hypothetical protein
MAVSLLHEIELDRALQSTRQGGFQHPTELCHIMASLGSDKGKGWHNYTVLYHALFSRFRDERINIFELGIGTTRADLPSTMGNDGVPGASLRGWSTYFPRARIYGADIDPAIIFQEDRIATFWTDQRQPNAIRLLWHKVADVSFDIMIDDGLHDARANVLFFLESYARLKPGGIYVVEDVQPRDVGMIRSFAASISSACKGMIFEEIDHPSNKVDNRLLIIQKR